MTASDLLTYLEGRRVRLTPTPQLGLHYRAPRGVLTLVLVGILKACKAPLVQLLTTGEDLPLPAHVTVPETDYSRFLTWQTGKVPANAVLMVQKLPEPKYYDAPSPARTSKGRPCPKKKCPPTAQFTDGQPASLYFRPSGVCVSCWQRWDKRGSYTPEKQAQREALLAKKREAEVERIADTQEFPNFA
jgi:hypothetical protein